MSGKPKKSRVGNVGVYDRPKSADQQRLRWFILLVCLLLAGFVLWRSFT